MRKLISFTLFIAAAMANAQSIDKHMAMEKARTFIQKRMATAASSSSATSARRNVASQSTTLTDVTMPGDYLYGFNVGNNGGFVIVAADDSASVIGYADNGRLDADDMPDALKDYLKRMSANVQGAVSAGNAVDLTAEGTNSSSSNRTVRKAAAYTTDKAVGPLLTTSWSQFSPYYNLTPKSDNAQTLTCCVATALAQILYYLYATQDGQTTTTFTNAISSPNGAVSAPRTYNWSSMLPSYLGSYTDAQAIAVATLMRDCGYALNVNYGTSESTAYTSDVPRVASTYFGLASDAKDALHSSAESLFSTIDAELNNYRPVQVCGNGHSFVCDGRAADGIYYHFNFGYGGGNGFYCAGAYNGYDSSGMETVTGLRLADAASVPTETEELATVCKAAVRTMGLRPVGTIPGMYQQSYYETLKSCLDEAEAVIAGTSTSDATALINRIGEAEQNLVKYITPFDNNGYNKSGYTASGTSYRIHTYKKFSNNYAYAGWYYDNNTGHYEGEDPVICVYTYNTGSKWRFVYDTSSNGYFIGNNTLDHYITEMPGYGKDAVWCNYGYDGTGVTDNSDPATESKEGKTPNPCEVIPTDYLGDGTFAVTIRPMADGYTDDSQRYLTCWEESGSSSYVAGSYSTSSYYYVHGCDAYGDYYSKWILEPVFASKVTSTVPKASFAEGSVTIYKDKSATQAVTTNSKGVVTYSSSDISVATVDPATGEVTGVGIGKATITAAIGGTGSYNVSGFAPAVATYTVNVRTTDPIEPIASFASSTVSLEVGQTTTNTLYTNSDGAVSYTSSNTDYVTVDENTGEITAIKMNPSEPVTITADIAATADYKAASVSYSVIVAQTLQIDSISPKEGSYTGALDSIRIYYWNYIKEVKKDGPDNLVRVYNAKTGELIDSVYATIDPEDDACVLLDFTNPLNGGSTYRIVIPGSTIFSEDGEVAQSRTLTYKVLGALEPGIVTARVWGTPLADRLADTKMPAGADEFIATHPVWDMINYTDKGYFTTKIDIKSENEVYIYGFTGVEGEDLDIVYTNNTEWGDFQKVNGGVRTSYDGYVYWDIASSLTPDSTENMGYIRVMADTSLGGSNAHCWPDNGYGYVCISLYDYEEAKYATIYIDYFLDDSYNEGEEPDTDAITSTPQTQSAKTYYTLSGQRINRPEKRGIYIVGGKKVMIK